MDQNTYIGDLPNPEPESQARPKNNKTKFLIIGGLSLLAIAGGITAFLLINNQSNTETSSSSSSSKSSSSTTSASLKFDSDNWSYDSSNNVYYQIGVNYVENVVSSTYESFGIYVPGDYLKCTASGDAYSCEVDSSKEVNGYTAETAPIVMPVNTPGYSAQSAPTSYSYNTASSYLEEGIIYLYAGCRGRSGGGGGGPHQSSSSSSSVDFTTGAPYGVADLKAAIRYVRYNDSLIPGDKDEIYAFGHSGGGAQSAILGASGDSELYTPYLEEMGAAMTYDDGTAISDAISGVNSWCPITELQIADAAYEWNMGQFASSSTRASSTWTKALSNDLAVAYADYINNAGFKLDGETLSLSASSDGYYLNGSYYDYIMSVINRSLNNYLADNYSDTSSRASYVSGLGDWVSYDSSTDTATVSSLSGFVQSQKSASKDVGAFDDLDRGQAENEVFADTDNNALHFDSLMSNLLSTKDYSSYSDFDSSVASAYQSDLAKTDSQGNNAEARVTLYTPTDFILGKNSATPATHWRIRSGITQGDTALTTEANLALALKMNSSVKDVDFETVWAQGHTQAERTGNGSSNFISWVESLTK